MSPSAKGRVSGLRSQEQVAGQMSSATFVTDSPFRMGQVFVTDVNSSLGLGCCVMLMLRGIGAPLKTDNSDNRLSQWTISDYYRDSFVRIGLDTPPVANTMSRQPQQEQDGDSIIFRHSRYNGMFNDDRVQESSPVPTRSWRWSEETEDVPDRHQSYRRVARPRANQQLEECDEECIRSRQPRYDNSFNNNIPRDVASTMGRSQRWLGEIEDVPDRRLTYERQQSKELPPQPTIGRSSRWSGETEDVPDRHPSYRRF